MQLHVVYDTCYARIADYLQIADPLRFTAAAYENWVDGSGGVISPNYPLPTHVLCGEFPQLPARSPKCTINLEAATTIRDLKHLVANNTTTLFHLKDFQRSVKRIEAHYSNEDYLEIIEPASAKRDEGWIYFPPWGSSEPPMDATLEQLGICDNDTLLFLEQLVIKWEKIGQSQQQIQVRQQQQQQMQASQQPVFIASILKRHALSMQVPFECLVSTPNHIFATLLYTDADTDFASFVVSNYLDLHWLSGKWCTIHILENPTLNWREVSAYWRPMLSESVFRALSMWRCLATKPYPRGEMYELARTLNIPCDNLPCLVFFGDKLGVEKVVIHIKDISARFFRRVFSALDEARMLCDRTSTSGELIAKMHALLQQRGCADCVSCAPVVMDKALSAPITIEYDVAISFAGPDRLLASSIANAVQSAGYKVFYDAYESASLWGVDLYAHLTDVYSRRARVCLVIISRHYTDRLWTRHELRAAQSRAFEQQAAYILPLRIDDTSIEGVLPTTAFVDIRTHGEAKVVELLCEKLRLLGTE